MTDNNRERVLVFGDDMRIFLAVVRSLGRAGKEVHAAPFNWHAPALRSRYVRKVHYLPRYSDGAAAWRGSVLNLLQKERFDLIVPCCDRATLAFHNHREEFALYPIAIPNPKAMDLLFDKESTRRLCGDLGIPVVRGARLEPEDTAPGLASRFGLPLVVKPRRSYSLDRLLSSGKVWIADTEAELQAALACIRDPSSYLVETFFAGVGVGVSVLAHDGEIIQAFQHRRLREGRGGSSSYRISEPVNPELVDACQRICRHTRLNGVCMFEFRYDPGSGDWVLLETNARFWGSSPLPLSLGVDFPRFLYDLLVHGTEHPRAKYPAGVRSRNFMLDGLNLLGGLRRMRRGGVRAWLGDLGDFVIQPVRWVSGKERSDSFVKDDLGPAVWECAAFFRTFSQRLTRKRQPVLNRRGSEQGAPV